MKCFTSLCLALSLTTPVLAGAAEPESCKLVRFADVGWTDITVTTAMTRLLLGSLGYTSSAKRVTVPDTFKGMQDNKIDVFLGNWMPAQESELKAYTDAGSIETLRANLHGAKYTLAVPAYAYDAGLKSFADLAKYAKELDNKIYGIEPNNDGNNLIKKMIEQNTFGTGKFEVVESSEQKMLASVKRSEHLKQWIVFLGWAPHPMNTHFDMRYLEGGDEFFGPNLGGATVYTIARKNYAKECANVGTLLSNIEFSLKMENELMDTVVNQTANRRQASKEWLQANPQVLDTWLKGVTSRDGQPALAVIKAKLELAQ
ncbi:choline ABC transporter substrate-binding protein [Pseudomonas sp. 2FE]|uniref:choline ABC transporter substrate-binding protein n=1 Tax=Pseudomonas sp. 2FE TaxID=2502190 RepID=UPI0010F5FFBF|nr:choline ABC transporter substrate-binding protein [Pseudomonas sp. 2FE]